MQLIGLVVATDLPPLYLFRNVEGRKLDEIVRLGWVHSALSAIFSGDVIIARQAEVKDLPQVVRHGFRDKYFRSEMVT